MEGAREEGGKERGGEGRIGRRKTDEKLAARIWQRKRYSEGGRGEEERPRICIERKRECEIGGTGRRAKGKGKRGMARMRDGRREGEDGGRAEVDRELLAHK